MAATTDGIADRKIDSDGVAFIRRPVVPLALWRIASKSSRAAVRSTTILWAGVSGAGCRSYRATHRAARCFEVRFAAGNEFPACRTARRRTPARSAARSHPPAPALGLQIDAVQVERVLADDLVHADGVAPPGPRGPVIVSHRGNTLRRPHFGMFQGCMAQKASARHNFPRSSCRHNGERCRWSGLFSKVRRRLIFVACVRRPSRRSEDHAREPQSCEMSPRMP